MTTKTFKQVVFCAFSLLLVVLPAIFCLNLDSIFAVPKMIFLYVVVDFLLLCFVLNTLRERVLIFKDLAWSNYTRYFLMAAILSTIFSINIFSSLFGIENIFLGLISLIHIYFLGFIFVNFFPKEKIRQLLLFSIFGSLLVAVYSLLQHYGVIHFTDVSWTQNPSQRAFGTLGHANHLAAYLAFNIALIVGLLGIGKRRDQLLLALVMVILLWTLFLTGSRGGFLSLVGSLTIMCVFVLVHHKKVTKKIVIIGGVLLAFSVSTWYWQGDKIEKVPLFARFQQSLEVKENGSLFDRISWWKSSFSMYLDSPIFGTGLSTFSDAYNIYRRNDYKLPNELQDTITPEAAHNELLNILATQGILGFVSYILLFVYPLLLVISKLRKNKKMQDSYFLNLALLGATLTALLQTLVNFWVITTFTFFYIILACICLLNEDKKEQYFYPKKSYSIAIFSFLIITFVTASGFYSWQRIRAEYLLQKGDESKIAQEKESAYERAILAFPWDFSYHTKYADYTLSSIVKNIPDLNFNKYVHLSLSHYQDALKLNPEHPVIWGNYAISLLTYSNYQSALGEKEIAEDLRNDGNAAFKTAISLGVNNPIYTYHFALALEKNNFKEEAVHYYEEALKIRTHYKDAQERINKLRSS